MENNKDIGKAIREKLSDFDQSPDDKLWLKIEADLGQKKKRRILPFWFIVTAVLLSAGIGWVYQSRQSAPVNPGVPIVSGQAASDSAAHGKQENDTDKPSVEKPLAGDSLEQKHWDEKPQIQKTSAASDGKIVSSHTYSAGTRKKTAEDTIGRFTKKRDSSLARNSKTKSKKAKTSWDKKDNTNQKTEISQNEDGETAAGIVLKTDDKTFAVETLTSERKPIPEEKPTEPAKTDSLKPAKNKKADKKTDEATAIEKIAQKLDIFVYAAPTYAGNFSNASPLDRRLNGNKKTSEIKLSYGAYCIYETDDKWSLRFGLALMNLRYVTENATVNTIDYDYIAYSGSSNVMIYAQSGDKTMDIIQDVSYLEIPLGFKYALRQSKWGINLYGGLSYMLLTKNEVSARTAGGMRFELGEAETLSDNTFTVNAGIGLDYKLTKQLRFNLEPVFKLHLFDYKNLSTRPYSIGVLAGLQFSLK